MTQGILPDIRETYSGVFQLIPLSGPNWNLRIFHDFSRPFPILSISLPSRNHADQGLLNHIGPSPLSWPDWDNGLLLGDRDATVNKALVTLDVTPNAVDKAIERGCDLIVSHHPLIFRPLKSLTDPLLLKLAARGIAVICLHTNLDVAPYGVNHALADALGLQVTGRLSPETGNRWQHISVTVPPAKAEDVARAAFAAGAGRIGNYGSCSTRHPITGTFLPGQGARPQLEQPDAQGLSRVEEVELEFMADSLCLPQVLQAIRAAHPYETPALYHFPVANANPAYGLGLLGEFVPRLSLGEIPSWSQLNWTAPRPASGLRVLTWQPRWERWPSAAVPGGRS